MTEKKGKGKQDEASKAEEWTQVARWRPLAHNGGRRPETQLPRVGFSPSVPRGIAPARPQMPLFAFPALMADGAAHHVRGHRSDSAHEGTPGAATALHVSDLETSLCQE